MLVPVHSDRPIEQTIQESESTHAGQLYFAVEGALDDLPLLRDQTARDRAIELFSASPHLGYGRQGVLIHLLLADRRVEIVAARGIHAKAGPGAWDAVRQRMEAAFASGDFEKGVIDGIHAVGTSRDIARRHEEGTWFRDRMRVEKWQQ